MNLERFILEKGEGIAVITLNRPETLNALDVRAFEELDEMGAELREDGEVRVLILTGAGRAFCSGVDVSLIDVLTKLPPAAFRRKVIELQGVFSSLEEMEKPVIAAVNGFALGAGCDLALACDLRIASEKAMLGEQYIKVGLIPDMGGTQRLSRLVGIGKAKELIFTGDMINGREAVRIGMVNRVVAPEELLLTAKSLAKRLAQGPSVAIGVAKLAINRSRGVDIYSGLEYESYGQSLCMGTEDRAEGVAAFLEKREPRFKGR